MTDTKRGWESTKGIEYGDVKIDKSKAKWQSIRSKNGCFRSLLGKIVTKEEFEVKKRKILENKIYL